MSVREPSPAAAAAAIAESERLAKLGPAELVSYVAATGAADRYWASPEPLHRWPADYADVLAAELQQYEPSRTVGGK